jgi:hypothetical protein
MRLTIAKPLVKLAEVNQMQNYDRSKFTVLIKNPEYTPSQRVIRKQHA